MLIFYDKLLYENIYCFFLTIVSKLILFEKQTKKRKNKQKGSAYFIMTLILKFESKVRNESILRIVTFDPIRPVTIHRIFEANSSFHVK